MAIQPGKVGEKKGARGTKGHFRDGVRLQAGRPERPKLITSAWFGESGRTYFTSQPRSQSSWAISNVTSSVKLFRRISLFQVSSKPPPLTRIARTGLGTRLFTSLS